MKKLVLVSLAVMLSASMVFASGNTEQKETETAATGLNITVVTTPSGVDDGSFNENVYDGAMAFAENHPGSKVTPLREPSGNVAKAVKLAGDVVADYDVEVCSGFQFSGITEIAEENPDTQFILVDTFPTDNAVLDNIYAMTFAEQESGFFAGIAAALESKTGKVAVVNGVAYPSNVNYQYGFECGVKYANAKYNKSVECVELPSQAGTDVTGANVGGNYIGSFADEATGKIVANELINKGVDIMLVAAGGSGNGSFTAAKESNGKCMIIGCDVDQWEDGFNGDENIILTSVLKNMAINVERALNRINDGTFQGENVVLTAATDSTGFVSDPAHQQMSDDTIAKLNEAYELVKDGTIVPASNFGGFTPDEFQVN
ncbi:MAG: BMP family ABC transporter substrate-binding protein [Sphaerochaetaceae bacterium]|nr:BMP family ABC transporter substrate-binding protein [Sphaerochaetaceae bacterium]